MPRMRSKASNSGQSSGSNDQKKSVFDRLGRQLDLGRGSMKRRPSPGPYGDYMPPPPPSGHEPDFGRYGREPHAQAELEWRYQNERRQHMLPFASRDRHMSQLPPPGHYEMDMQASRQPPSYYSHPYHGGQAGPLPGPPNQMGPMSMHQQQRSPKYDRQGNPIGFKERGGASMSRMGGPMDHHVLPGMSPPRSFMPGPPMMHPHQGHPHEMPTMRAAGGDPYPPHRWNDNMEPEFAPHPGGSRMLPEGRFSPAGSRRHQQQQQQMSAANSQPIGGSGYSAGDGPRLAKWRERRDVITTLDRETAQSSSRTDSLKSTLQQPDSRVGAKGSEHHPNAASAKTTSSSNSNNNNANKQQPQPEITSKKASETNALETGNEKNSLAKEDTNKKDKSDAPGTVKTEPQDISDGEIVDDEDSSDDSETDLAAKSSDHVHPNPLENQRDNYLNRTKAISYTRVREPHQYYDSAKATKKRRIHEREDYSMDYETISDDDLDDFMADKKIAGINEEDTKLSEEGGKSVSEIELLNALGLDWANLVEMAKQSKTSSKEAYQPGSALPRFSMPNYLPTLGITKDLAGPELYELILKVCRS